MDYVISILEVIISWPVLVLFLVLIYRNEIQKLFGRIKKAYGFEWEDTLRDKFPGDKAETRGLLVKPGTIEKYEYSIKWKNVANLYWVGHDLMWTIDLIFRGAPGRVIIHGLKQSLHHIRELGFTNNPHESKLAKLLDEAKVTYEKDWTPQLRSIFAGDLISIRDGIGVIVNSRQKDFKPRPEN